MTQDKNAEQYIDNKFSVWDAFLFNVNIKLRKKKNKENRQLLALKYWKQNVNSQA